MIKEIKKEQIEGNFRGYLWYSDAVFPKLIWDEPVTKDMLKSFPFVIEGQLYDQKNRIAIRIANIDGAYHVAQMQLPANFAENQTYYASNKFARYSSKQEEHYDLQLNFYTHYEEKESQLQSGFVTKQPVWTAFVGFSEDDLVKPKKEEA